MVTETSSGASFHDLPIARCGVEAWHLNRFRIAFRHPQKPIALAQQFINNFCTLLDSPAATVEVFDGDHYKFNGKISLSRDLSSWQPHYDWVRRITGPAEFMNGFTVQTLKRESMATDDILPAVVGAAVGGYVGIRVGALFGPIGAAAGTVVGGLAGGAVAVDINRHHFLAGRRAWRLDHAHNFVPDGLPSPFPDDAYILETSAMERFSEHAFWLAKPLLEHSVVYVWCNLLGNFLRQFQGRLLAPSEWPLEPGWQTDGRTGSHWIRTEGGEGTVKGTRDFAELRRLYPRLTD